VSNRSHRRRKKRREGTNDSVARVPEPATNGRVPWWRWLPDKVRVSGLILLLFLGFLTVTSLARVATEPLMEYEEDGREVDVRVDGGCLIYWRYGAPRTRPTVLSYCGAVKPEGADGWAVQIGEMYVVDQSQRSVIELVAFGVMPDGVARVRYTLPGGHPVETDTRRVQDVASPVVLLHLRKVALPVDLTETDGRKVFVRLQLFDAAGQEVSVV